MTILDLSDNDLSTLDPECWKAHGVTGVICGVYDPVDPPHKMANAMDACLRGGLELIAGYGLVYFGDVPEAVERDTKWQIELGREFGVNLQFSDCEIDAHAAGWWGANLTTPMTPEMRNEQLAHCHGLIRSAGMEPGVYTGGPWWTNAHGNTTAFSGRKLWYANYGANDGLLAPIRSVNFGGWTEVWAHQYTSLWGRVNGCGRDNRDASYLFEEELDMNALARLDRLEAIVIGNGFDAICRPGTEELFPPGTPVVPEGEDGPRIRLTGEPAIEYARRRGFSLGLAVEQEQTR